MLFWTRLCGAFRPLQNLDWILRRAAGFLIWIYRHAVAPWLTPSCRFEPTCSRYAAEAFREKSFWEAFKLTVHRLSRCRPGGGYGLDPLPGHRISQHD